MDNLISIRYSKDNGHTWSNWRQVPIGDLGEYAKRVRATGFGRFRQVVFQTAVSARRRRDIIAAYATVEALDA